ncbi:hypothetical protein PC129_g9723 [Phytophthora cactorum]|uniref:Uncharacterized protein n=2 Tax=Phytophthora cactorum TaxID=29920 RepID=A0A329ST49_9STRA|nr:hypothetical protein Pcac1_g2164 [Phytophthora cactorum]KAG2821413.1 hypothetical protein PC112_g11385 [Phytophthora cactorum]KAG2903088.1 hypothetical protein PC114_g12415 [Phytophthora cactorum]KAG2936937.1 hypothetical protein PC117_g11886 [Phytophthora cactorum]KAG2980418.1 hypothetical protein PC118_g11185 [Phytophthora cactorum]
MTRTFSSSASPSPVRSIMTKLLGRSSDKMLPRKLVSTPFAASLLSPLPPDEMLQRRLQLQRIVDIFVLDATRGKKNQLVITLKLSLKPEAPREQVGISIPNNTSVAHEITMTFHDVKQLSRVLVFCVDESARGCDDSCEWCSRLRTYLSNHWARDPLVTVINMGETILRKPSLAMHLAQLVAFATGTSMALAVVVKDKTGVHLVPQLSPLGQPKKKNEVCAAQNAVAAVICDFFGVFGQTSTASVSTTKEL